MTSLSSQVRFDAAIKVILAHEGGLSDHKDDPGDITNFGITLPFLQIYYDKIGEQKRASRQDIIFLTKIEAEHIYKTMLWDHFNYNSINSISIATKIFDMAVNMGAIQAHKLAQRACRYVGHNLNDDGILGIKTLIALNEISLHGREDDLMDELREHQKGFYELLVEENPKLQVFLKGWLARATQ